MWHLLLLIQIIVYVTPTALCSGQRAMGVSEKIQKVNFTTSNHKRIMLTCLLVLDHILFAQMTLSQGSSFLCDFRRTELIVSTHSPALSTLHSNFVYVMIFIVSIVYGETKYYQLNRGLCHV